MPFQNDLPCHCHIREYEVPKYEVLHVKVYNPDMFERMIIFMVLGIFVFTPALSSWWKNEFQMGYEVYLPWVLLIIAAAGLHWRTDHRHRD